MSKAIFVRWSPVYNDKLSVKVTNQMTIREIRDHVCEKRKLTDPSEFDIEFNGKKVELDQTVLRLNLLQGAKLDLVKAPMKIQANAVTLTLELESGGKLIEKVPCSQNLWDILVYFQTQLRSPGKFTNPTSGRVVLFYQGKELFTEEHLKLSLEDLGIAPESSATIGVAFRELSAEGTVAQPFTPIPKEPRQPAERTPSEPSQSSTPATSSSPSSSSSGSLAGQVQFDSTDKGKGKATERAHPQIPSAHIQIPADREIQVFGAPTQTRDLAAFDVPEELYELDKSDLIRLQISSERNKTPEILKTKAMRDQEEKQKRAKHSKTTIRIKLPDQIIIQGIFSPDEPASALYEWVRSIMKNTTDFELFVTPPRRTLPDSTAGLYHLGLVPSAVVFLAWKGEDNAVTQPLKGFLYEKIQELQIPEFLTTREESQHKAEEAALRRLKQNMEGAGGEEGSSQPSGGSSSAKSSSQGKAAPKWFMEGKKPK